MLAYPVELTPDGKFLMVTFPDIPEANSQGDSVEDALSGRAGNGARFLLRRRPSGPGPIETKARAGGCRAASKCYRKSTPVE
jgi:hypothetical protein